MYSLATTHSFFSFRRFLGVKMDQVGKVEWLTGKVDWVQTSATKCPKYDSWTSGTEFSPFTGVIVDPSTLSGRTHPQFEPAGTTRLNKIVCQFLGPILSLGESSRVRAADSDQDKIDLLSDGTWDPTMYSEARASFTGSYYVIIEIGYNILFQVSWSIVQKW